ncbi:RING/FYVE/PHD zinc finger superfamily protein [Wolffia australiana]
MNSANATSKKRMRSGRTFRFKAFCDPWHPMHIKGSSFREKISSLLEFGCRAEMWNGLGIDCWSFHLEVPGGAPDHVSLFIVEEMVEASDSLRCQHCTTIGWGRHLVCRKRFHFVVLSKNGSGKSSESTCNLRQTSLMATLREPRSLSVRRELLHGIVHSNGFGHLLSVNGIETGSEILSGHEILDLWDRICKGLGVRKVSLADTARKRGMELRLLHVVAYGEPWFARWGYRFGRESFGVTLEIYQKSIEALRSLPLCLLIPHCGTASPELANIIAKYQDIAGYALVTLGQLFNFMMELKGRLPHDAFSAIDYQRITMEPACRWSSKRLEMAAHVIVDALKKANFKWVSRQEVRDAARAYVGDTGLLDFVLKSLGNHVVGNYIVRRMVNPVMKILEYRLELVSGGSPNNDSRSNLRKRPHITRAQVRKDLVLLYKCILLGQSLRASQGIFPAVRAILDVKHMLKCYLTEIPTDNAQTENNCVKLFCTVSVRHPGLEDIRPLIPYEELAFPRHVTIGEVKAIVEKTFKEIYLGLKTFVAESIVNVDFNDAALILESIQPGSHVVVNGFITEGDSVYFACEREHITDRIVKCACGSVEEDAERMVGCVFCNVWQHTRCVGIDDNKSVSPFFLCTDCENDIALLPSLSQ